MLEKVYLVRYGCYSDQGIAGTFSTKEKAQRYCDIHNEIHDEWWHDEYWVDEFIVDLYEVNPVTQVVTYYTVGISTIDDDFQKKGEIIYRQEEKDIFSRDTVIEKYVDYISVKSTKSMEHAEKVALEQYQKYTQQELEDGKV